MTLKDQLYANNYLIIDNFIDPKEANSIYELLKSRVCNDKEFFELEPFLFNEAYGMKNMREGLKILIDKTKFLSDIIEEPLIPTYSYIRLYKKNGKLSKHRDRPSCEISVTIHLGSDGKEWKLGIEKPNKEEILLTLNQGQAIIYLGCQATHWRLGEYQGNDYGQLFLHYVKIFGENWLNYFDMLHSLKKQ